MGMLKLKNHERYELWIEMKTTWWCHQKEEVGRRWMLMEEDEQLARHCWIQRESIREENNVGIKM